MAGAAPAIAAPAAPAGGAPAPVTTPAGAKGGNDSSKAGPEGAAAAAPAETAKPPEPRRFKAKYKADGREQELDLAEEDAVREIQKARHFDKTRGEFEQRERSLRQEIEAISKDPMGFLRKNGVDLRSIAAQEQAREAELAALSPEARRAAELEQRNQQLEEQIKQHGEQNKQAAAQAEHTKLVQSTARTLDNALKLSGRQRSGELLKTYADVMEMAERAGEPPLSPEQLVAGAERLELQRVTGLAKRAATDPAWRARNAPAMSELAKAILPTLEGQELIDFIGKENGVRIAKAQLAQFRKNPIPVIAGAESQGGQPAPAPAARQQPRQSASVWQTLDKLAG